MSIWNTFNSASVRGGGLGVTSNSFIPPTPGTVTGFIAAITYGNGVYVIQTQSGFFWSNDLYQWNPITMPDIFTQGNLTDSGYKLIFDGTYFIAAGAKTTTYNPGNAYIYFSIDGINWNSAATTLRGIVDIHYVNGYYYVDSITDGVRYGTTLSNISSTPVNIANAFNVNYANSIYVSTANFSLKYSNDGVNWSNGVGTSSALALSSYINNNNLWINFGSGVNPNYRTSSDGINWGTAATMVGTIAITARGIIHSPSISVVFGPAATTSDALRIITTTNGTTWTARTVTATLRTNFYDMIWDGNKFVGVGESNSGLTTTYQYIATSTDGITWTRIL